MKEYISNRLLAIILALGLLASIVLCAYWKIMDAPTIGTLLGVIATSLRDLLRVREAELPVAPISTAAPTLPPPSIATRLGPLSVLLGALVGGGAGAAGGLLLGCGHGVTQQEARSAVQTVEITTEACESIASLHGREDVASYCHSGAAVLSLVDRLLAESEQAKERLQIREASCVVQSSKGPGPDGGAPLEQRR